MTKYGVFSGIQENTFPVFSPNTGKYGQEKTSKSHYSVEIRENTDQKKLVNLRIHSEYRKKRIRKN